MSTEIALANVKVPAHLANRLGQASSIGASMGGGISDSVSIPRISMKGSRFRIIEGGAETVMNDLSLEVIIVGANPNLNKLWYERDWKPDAEPGAPDCYSMDSLKPALDAKKPQADSCAQCPKNAWGSKVSPNGQKVKACSDNKRLAVVAANDPGGTVYLLQVTPAALKPLNQYQKSLQVRGIPAEIVKTKISFDHNVSFPKLAFDFGGFIDEETQKIVDTRFGTPEVLEVTGQAQLQEIKIEIAKPMLVKEVAEHKPQEIVDATFEPAKPLEAPRRGFGGQTVATTPAAKPAAKEADAAQATTSKKLFDDISSLIDNMEDDDGTNE